MTVTHSEQLPNEPIFQKLIDNRNTVPHAVINDPTCNVVADYCKLLHDIVALRQELYATLPTALFNAEGLVRADAPYILVQSPGNYEFIVACFAVLACGGAVVPIGPGILPEEAFYFLADCQSSILLTSSACMENGVTAQQYAKTQGYDAHLIVLSADKWSQAVCTPGESVGIDQHLTIDPNRPSLVLYTSGTTGPPKGVVQCRPYFAHGYGTSTKDLFLTHRPVHWIGGLRSIINLVVSATRQEMVQSNHIAIWDRLRKRDVTILCCVIPMWCKLMQHYEEVLIKLPPAELEEYLAGMRALRVARVGGACPMPSLLRFWRDTIGIPLEVTYGCTETGGPGMMTDSTCDRRLESSLGKPEKGVDVRLSAGDEGEVLIKSSFVFAGYLGDESKTRECFTPDGYFKTGDYGRRVGDEYVMEGRTSTDFVRFHGYKVPVIEVETRMAELPFVSEVCIVSVPDRNASTRVAALVRFQPGVAHRGLSAIREGLSKCLSLYKLPTALRVLEDNEEIPTTVIGKVMRRKVVDQYFPTKGGYDLPPEVELWDINQKPISIKKWDWDGLSGC